MRVFKNPKSEMSSKKVLKKNFITKGIIFIFSFILRKYYLIYEEGREYNISRVVK